jgi:tRNA nucleotidyltransferase (CCA-adding enzyme)
LGRPVDDYDFVTDATPDEMKEFLENADYTFSKFGTIRLSFYGRKVDIVTLRTEGEYADYRHPKTIKYIRRIEEDYVRRDFTINALYIDKKFNVFDFCGGLQDLKNGIIRLIGDPEKRIREDPLRILRAERFAKKLGFVIDEQTLKAIKNNRHLLKELNPDKVREEQNK